MSALSVGSQAITTIAIERTAFAQKCYILLYGRRALLKLNAASGATLPTISSPTTTSPTRRAIPLLHPASVSSLRAREGKEPSPPSKSSMAGWLQPSPHTVFYFGSVAAKSAATEIDRRYARHAPSLWILNPSYTQHQPL